MAVPSFYVPVMLLCKTATAEGPRGPGALARLPYTLEGVSYVFKIEQNKEAPIELEELWLYVRLIRKNFAPGDRELGLRLFRIGSRLRLIPGC